MVCGRMGLLDEAIRDHLELKRRRGADPGEIAREEREALDPSAGEALAEEIAHEEPELDPADVAPPHGDALEPEFEASELGAERPAEDPGQGEVAYEPAGDIDRATIGQETAELDMQAVLDADAHTEAEPAAEAPVRAPGEPLPEWELADRATAEPPPEPLPGQERLTFE